LLSLPGAAVPTFVAPASKAAIHLPAEGPDMPYALKIAMAGAAE
jgi:hypothetical protein